MLYLANIMTSFCTSLSFSVLKMCLGLITKRFLLGNSVLLSALVLSGCASSSNNDSDSFSAILELSSGQGITAEYLRSTPFASTIVRVNDSKPVLLVLSLVDDELKDHAPRLTWLSKDRARIVTENGRIVMTTGFSSSNLEGLANVEPLSLPTAYSNWKATYDWSPGYRYGFTAAVTSEFLGEETVQSILWEQPTQRIREQVQFEGLKSHIVNDFWVAPATSTTKAYVVKSTQYLGPNMDKVDMLMIKPFIELIGHTDTEASQ